MKKGKIKNGVSLIVLVITIIVIIILAGAVLVNFSQNNPISNAKKAEYLNDFDSFKSELLMYEANLKASTLGEFDETKLQADDTSIIYTGAGTINAIGTIKDIITGLKSGKYTNEFQILNGELVYKGTDAKRQEWTLAISGKETTSNFTVNAPVLAIGMTARKWNGTTSTWDIVENPNTDTSWYDYANKQWANAQTLDGSMWVWIPRYEYKIPTPHSSTAQTIEVNFLQDTSTAATSGYTVHPAFTFGSTELTGIWVAKFEASGTTTTVTSKPNVTPLANITIGAMFTACRNMETTYGSRYGWGTSGIDIDTHQIKNVEWGAVAYLSSSVYGKTGEIWLNPYWNASTGYSLTGQAGTSVGASYPTTTYAYNDVTYGVNASTTGNIYGIYDMSGGSMEYTAAYVNNGNTNLTTYGASLVNAANEYKDVYTSSGDTGAGNYSAASSKKGDAIYETSNSGEAVAAWYSRYSYMPYSGNAFFTRGGFAIDSTTADVFAFYYGSGNPNTIYGFRPCLVVDTSL